ncbi:MAG: GNAT family N-acetyltransferase [Pseudomonadota bacterium]
MADELIIRPLKADDHKDWRRLWTEYLSFYETSVSEEVYRTSFERLLSGEKGEYQCLIAAQGGKAVGLAHFLFHRFMWTVEDTCYLMDLYTDPDVRGNGIGRALIEAVHQAANANGVPSTYWATQEFNYKGRMLYDQVAERTPFIIYEKND